MRLSSFGSFFLIVPVAGAVFAAIWLTAAAAYENVHFANTSGQVLSLIALLQDDASKDEYFAKQANQDLLTQLIRRGQIPMPQDGSLAKLENGWHRPIRLMLIAPSVAKLETDVPAAACRRLALLFGSDAPVLKLQVMEARAQNGAMQSIFDKNNNQKIEETTTEDACGKVGQSTLALILQLR